MGYTSTSAFYDSLGLRYEQAYGHAIDHIAFVQEALQLLAPDVTVLDTGSGTGKPTASMIAASGRKLHGIDFSANMISIAKAQVPEATFEEANMLDWTPAQPFDAAISTFALLNFPHPQMKTIIANYHAWIKPNGYLFIGTLLPHDFPLVSETSNSTACEDPHAPRRYLCRFMGSEQPIYLYNEEGWKALLEGAGFKILKTSAAPFTPPKEADSDSEMHYYIIAQSGA